MGQPMVSFAKMEALKQTETKTKTRTGVEFSRYFTASLAPEKTPYDEVQWETRTASIGNDKGAIIFEQRDVEVHHSGTAEHAPCCRPKRPDRGHAE